MKIFIVGCGAIGSICAAHLATLTGVSVWAFDPDEAHVQAINSNGLKLTGLHHGGWAYCRAGLVTQAVDDPRGVKWAKLIFNSSANAVCALTRLPFYSMYSQPALRDLALGLELAALRQS